MAIFYVGITIIVSALVLLAIESPILFIIGLLALAFVSVTK